MITREKSGKITRTSDHLNRPFVMRYIRVALLHVEFILMVINFVIRYLVIIILLLLCRADSREPIVSIVG